MPDGSHMFAVCVIEMAAVYGSLLIVASCPCLNLDLPLVVGMCDFSWLAFLVIDVGCDDALFCCTIAR